MIISATRRTDIPAFYGEWFVNRLKAGFVFIQNPYNQDRFSYARLDKEAVDIIVFWTKNPIPFLPYLEEIDKMGHKYYFQFTLTPYGNSVEQNLPSKHALVTAFKDLAKKLGKHAMVWRYDPVIIDEKYTVAFHLQKFEEMAKQLHGSFEQCVFSFVDGYKNVSKRMHKSTKYDLSQDNVERIAIGFSATAQKMGFQLSTCSEKHNLSKFGIGKSSCIDKERVQKILGTAIDVKKDSNQRAECNCIESIDIGTYNCCANGCNYCYAITDTEQSAANMKRHDKNSSTLIGQVRDDAIITMRKWDSVKVSQCSLFDKI